MAVVSSLSPTLEKLGVLGQPQSLTELAAKPWDVIVVGAGHNGLTCAAYLARAGKRVLVLEARERVGGACTLEEPWPGYTVSPCAYLAGLIHPVVIQDFDLPARGFKWYPAQAGLFVPFEDGSHVQLWEDAERCHQEIRRVAPNDLSGWKAFEDLFAKTRNALRRHPDGDVWLDIEPARDKIESRLSGDRDATAMLFEWSMAELLERYLDSEKLHLALLGQGVIGTNASPFDPGTAFIHFHHSAGIMGGLDGAWGYVKGGLGVVSFLLCDAALEWGATVTCDAPVARICPGEGVELLDGKRIAAPIVVSNADPRTTLHLLGGDVDPVWKRQAEALPQTGCTMKVNVALTELPNFRARPGLDQPHHYAQVNIPLSKQAWQDGFATAQAGALPEQLWTELYFQTSHDPTIAPAGMQVMSVFAQYVPHTFASGDWESRRDEAGRLALRAIARHCSNMPGAVAHVEVLGPPDIELKVGLAGGHIFQGECLPDFMWDRRLGYKTPMDGVYLCGACTHPGGSVICVNGRNAAMSILKRA